MFEYDHWANRECLKATRRGVVVDATVGRVSHILSAEKLWLERLRGEKQSMAVWPNATIEQCERLVDEMAPAWRENI